MKIAIYAILNIIGLAGILASCWLAIYGHGIAIICGLVGAAWFVVLHWLSRVILHTRW